MNESEQRGALSSPTRLTEHVVSQPRLTYI